MSILFRADASIEIGMGHVMRSLALAQALQDGGGIPVFATVSPTAGLRDRFSAERMRMESITADLGSPADAMQTMQIAKAVQANWVVIDGYAFTGKYENILTDAGLKVLAIDDYGHTEHSHADWVLNQNLLADEALYRNRGSHTGLLLGSQYALLRREFRHYHNPSTKSPPLRKVLVTLGGSDSRNATHKVMEALATLDLEDLQTVVIAGGNNPHLPSLRHAIERMPGTSRLLTDVKEMHEMFSWADVAISAGGSTCWELAFMGVPNLIVVLAENQRCIARRLAEAGVSIELGDLQALSTTKIAESLTQLLNSPSIWSEMSQKGKALIDARGAQRVLKVLAERTDPLHEREI